MTASRVLVLGLRGIPDVEGGIERHAEHLYPRLVALGCSVELVARSAYHPHAKPLEYRGVRITRLWSPSGGAFETFIHTFLGTLYAAIVRPDVLHLHAIGPALFTPLARLFGLRVVVTHHGPDYDREKWGRFAKGVLRLGERVGMRFSNQRIAISRTIQNLIYQLHARDSLLIPNGVDLPNLPRSCDTPMALGLVPRKYVLQVSRLVPEKRQLDLIRAFEEAGLKGWKLALVGSIDGTDAYAREVMQLARRNPNVVLTGFQRGLALQELYGNAGVFVLPSSHEGLPIALLEALSFGLPVIASDIPANVEIGLPADSYFSVGNVMQLVERLAQFGVADGRIDRAARAESLRRWVAERYNWDVVARQTLEAYRSIARS